MVVFNLSKAKEEIAIFLRNNNLITTSVRGVTTVQDVFTGNGTDEVFNFTNSRVKNVRQLMVQDPLPPPVPGTPSTLTINKQGSNNSLTDGWRMCIAIKPTEDDVTLKSITMSSFGGSRVWDNSSGVGRLYQYTDDTFTNASNEFFKEALIQPTETPTLIGTYNINTTTRTFTINQAITSNYDYIFITQCNGSNLVFNWFTANSGNHLNASDDALRIRGATSPSNTLGSNSRVSLDTDRTYMLDNVVYERPGTPTQPPRPPAKTLNYFNDYDFDDMALELNSRPVNNSTITVDYDYGNTDRIFPDYSQENIRPDNVPRIAFDVIGSQTSEVDLSASVTDSDYNLQFSVFEKDRKACDRLANRLINLLRQNKKSFKNFYFISPKGMGPLINVPWGNFKVVMRPVNAQIYNKSETGE